MVRTFIILTSIFLICLMGCQSKEEKPTKKELLIYCGITMIHPIMEIAKIIEQEKNCTIKVSKGGSGNLYRSLKTNRLGDLYLPGSESYIKQAVKEGLVTDTVFLGYNQAALIVQKGNPKKITNDPICLVDKSFHVVLGNPESGSIGKETKTILEKIGIFKEAIANAAHLTIDSKDLTKEIKEKHADLTMNWYATAIWPENRPFMDALKIDEIYAKKKRLILGLLIFSKHPEIARRFQEYAASPQGHSIFMKYGFLDQQEVEH